MENERNGLNSSRFSLIRGTCFSSHEDHSEHDSKFKDKTKQILTAIKNNNNEKKMFITNPKREAIGIIPVEE